MVQKGLNERSHLDIHIVSLRPKMTAYNIADISAGYRSSYLGTRSFCFILDFFFFSKQITVN